MKTFNQEHYNAEQNDAAREAYVMEMEGRDPDKGVRMYTKPYLWDEAKPASHMDIPAENFVPTQTMRTDGFSSYSTVKKIAMIGMLVLVGAVVIICGILHFSHY